nr:nucleoporin-interacting protein [Anoxybacillus amylolyticus]
MYASPYAATWDQVDFVLALDRYDLLSMQPHFPGYPYFILGGMIVHSFVENPAKALVIFNVLLLASANIPLFLLARKYGKEETAWLVVALVQSASYAMIIVTQPMSEGAALAVLWWYVWAVERAHERLTFWEHVLPLFFLGILLGIRLSYLPFVVALLCLWYNDWKQHHQWRRIIFLALIALSFQLIWVIAVASTEGNIISFLKLAFSFTNGHFQEWGGTVSSDPMPFWQRTIHFFIFNVLWVGMACQSMVLLGALGWMFLTSDRSNRVSRTFLITMVAYLFWALAAQNIDKPRHILPLAQGALFYGAIHYLARNNLLRRRLLISGTIIVQLLVGIFHLREAQQLPATYQLANDLQKKTESFIVYTWEEARVFDYLHVAFPYQEALHFSFFHQHRANYQQTKIYLTDHVVKGFRAQGVPLTGHLRKIKTYHSSTLVDPVYGNITLYEWID